MFVEINFAYHFKYFLFCHLKIIFNSKLLKILILTIFLLFSYRLGIILTLKSRTSELLSNIWDFIPLITFCFFYHNTLRFDNFNLADTDTSFHVIWFVVFIRRLADKTCFFIIIICLFHWRWSMWSIPSSIIKLLTSSWYITDFIWWLLSRCWNPPYLLNRWWLQFLTIPTIIKLPHDHFQVFLFKIWWVSLSNRFIIIHLLIIILPKIRSSIILRLNLTTGSMLVFYDITWKFYESCITADAI